MAETAATARHSAAKRQKSRLEKPGLPGATPHRAKPQAAISALLQVARPRLSGHGLARTRLPSRLPMNPEAIRAGQRDLGERTMAATTTAFAGQIGDRPPVTIASLTPRHVKTKTATPVIRARCMRRPEALPLVDPVNCAIRLVVFSIDQAKRLFQIYAVCCCLPGR